MMEITTQGPRHPAFLRRALTGISRLGWTDSQFDSAEACNGGEGVGGLLIVIRITTPDPIGRAGAERAGAAPGWPVLAVIMRRRTERPPVLAGRRPVVSLLAR